MNGDRNVTFKSIAVLPLESLMGTSIHALKSPAIVILYFRSLNA